MEGSSSSDRGKSWAKDGFTDLLLSWSVEEILDEDMYKGQVEKIPDSFESVDQYLDSYVKPLLEEVRSELASAMEAVAEAPFCEIKSVTGLKHGELVYDVEVDYWINRVRGGGEPYRTLPGDFVILSDSQPCDMQCSGWTCNFASVIRKSEGESGDSCTTSGFRLKTAHNVEVENIKNKPLYMVYLMNMTPLKRIWSALKMRRNLNIIEKVLKRNDLDEEICEFCHLKSEDEVEERLGSTYLSNLNESQMKAILASISKIECKHKFSVQLLWGPPGTGKTTTLSILLYILLRMNVRTVVCAPSNTAITGLASRVVALVRDSVETEAENRFSFCSLGEMLIFGNKENLKVGSVSQEIFIDYRVERLVECLGPMTGWKCRIALMIEFLEGCVSKHQVYKDNEPNRSRQFLRDEVLQHRDEFKRLASSLKTCMLTITTHLPRNFINWQNCRDIVKLISLLDSVEKLLFEGSCTTSSELEAIFLHKVVSSLSVLRFLKISLDNLGLPKITDRTSSMEFCFRKASMVFCTTSSSYKLYSQNTEPFQLVIIDEAAQLKECETTIALQLPDVRHAILVGDEMQLPATVTSKLSKEAGFGRSLFERLSTMGHPKHLLNVQYRMHPSISRFPNSKFYYNQILDAPNVQNESYGRFYLEGRMFGPYSFINVRGGREEFEDVGHSRKNMVEVAIVWKLVGKLFKAWNGSKEKMSIGLISPYAAQVSAIRDRILPKYGNHEGFEVKVMSVDGFQGGEEDIVIISTVRSHEGGSIGFLSSPQRTNVALTRARHCLWILGNERTLTRSDSVWAALVADAKERQCFFNADEICDIRKIVIDVSKQLDQLDHLFSRESLLFENSRWQVLFSENFKRSLKKLKSSALKKLVLALLFNVANGWRPRNINVDRTFENSSYAVKQFKVRDYYVVCAIDIIKDSVYTQVLKVWDILPMVETSKLWKRLESIFCMYTDDYVNRCQEKLFEGNLEVPKTWPLCCDIIQYKDAVDAKANTTTVDCRTNVENSDVSESMQLMKFYSLTTGSANYLFSDLEGREVELPFEVTDEERRIILFPTSSFIQGRSGTGKTTILTMKLFQKHQLYCNASGDSTTAGSNVDISDEVDDQYLDEKPKDITLHQLFVTVSPKLCYAVKKHVSQLLSFGRGDFSGSVHLTGLDDIEEMDDFKDIPDTFVAIPQEKYPLIITFQKFLMMLDGALGNSFFQRFHDARDSCQYKIRTVALQTFMRKNEVTYDRFSSLYWPRMNEKLKKDLDASRVYTEIMSHIKGGLQHREACDVKQCREDYISLCDNRSSTLSSEKRKIIYDIFENYEKMKLQRGEFDLADLVMDIHHRLKKGHLLGDKMDFVYIDEVQDLTMRQILLFRYICNNVDEGFVFSGDTAQTVARGIDFRFEDIRSLFYNEFLMKSRKCDVSGSREKGLVSDIYCLSQNFRTHTGVLKLAQSVIDLIYFYFPNSIDSLAPETSRVFGEPPVVLRPGCKENSIISIFGRSAEGCQKIVGFGADQVILVRDDSARNEIFRIIGNQALVLTIVECKGLEFQDVLLYNFFGSSPMSNQWRVVHEFVRENYLHGADSPKSYPSFSESRHNILCSELKQLYVAITRTRQRLWICENNAELFQPMLDYWQSLNLVQVREVDDSLAKTMQRDSSHEEWKSRGIKLFWDESYEMAAFCFEKAGEETWLKRAKASRLRAAADCLRGSSSNEANKKLREAAEIFYSINFVESAVECFCDLGDYERAGEIYLEMCGVEKLRKAAECFSLAGNHIRAAEVYAKGNFFRECISVCIKGSYFDMGLQYIENWKRQASLGSALIVHEITEIEQELLEKKALQCYWSKDNASLLKIVRAFHSMDSKRTFLKSLNCLRELLLLEEESGNFIIAAEIARSLGDTLSEVDLLEKADMYEDACMLILSYVLSNSLWVVGNEGWPLNTFPGKVELLNRAMTISQKASETFHASICAEAEILLPEQSNLSELMQYYSASKKSESLTGEILCVRKLLDSHFQVKPLDYEFDSKLHLDTKTFDDIILRNQVSVGTLVCVWNLWKALSLKISHCLGRIDKLDLIKSEDTLRFCFNYFGVRKFPNSAAFHLLKPDAAWARNLDKYNTQNKTVEAYVFAPAARKFWHQEFISVGFTVLDVIQEVYKSSTVSEYSQSMCLLHIFDIAKFFLGSKLMDFDASKLQGFIELSSKFFDFVFPLDCRKSSSENMIHLRGTELSRNLLEDISCRNISTSSKLSYRQLGRMVMILLGYGKPNYSLSRKICERLSWNTSWKSFIEILGRSNKFWPSSESLSRVFHEALEETYNTNWRTDGYISPHCFFYLVERLVDLVPHSDQGFFFTSTSSLVEYLVCQPSDANPIANLFTNNKSNPGCIVDFVVRVVERSLLRYEETSEWIIISRIDCSYYLPVLMQKLIVILCLMCLNWDLPLDMLYEKLNVPHIRANLPIEFHKALNRSHQMNGTSFLAAVVEAFEVIGDPLVIVATRENDLKFSYPNAISLNLSSFSCKNEIMKTLLSMRSTLVKPRSLNPALVHEMPYSSESFACRNDVDFKSFALRMKAEMEEDINFLTSAMGQLDLQKSHADEFEVLICDVTCIIVELHMLSPLLDTSEFDMEAVDEIREALKTLNDRIPRVRTLLMSLLASDPNGSVVSTEIDDMSVSASVVSDLSNLQHDIECRQERKEQEKE